MNFNHKSEKDPARCRVLRQNERQIEIDRREANASFTAAMSEIKKMREERGRLKDKEKDLGIKILAATALSAAQGAIGHVLGGGASALNTQREILRSRIDALQRQIDQAKTKIDSLKNQKTVLATGLKRNADELRQLNCVR